MAKGIARQGLIYSVLIFPLCAQAALVSDLLITEVMVNPAAISDSRGEWFELFNPTDETINLLGTSLIDDGSDRHSFDSDLLVLPGQFLTLARSSTPGFIPDYVYGDFTLANSADEIIFSDGMLELLRLDYGGGFAVAGHSRELTGLPMITSNYALTLASLSDGSGDIGTPGRVGSLDLQTSASPVPLPPTAMLMFGALLIWALANVASKQGFSARLAAIIPLVRRYRSSIHG